jgi:hypothetical protein
MTNWSMELHPHNRFHTGILQIPLAKEFMKYCSVVTPFRGVRVYARSAMGMPGSETILEELTCRVLGDLLQEGVVANIRPTTSIVAALLPRT